ncbi:MAG TPA: hypothetical protein PLG90_13265 [Ignavibacteria bacterium]|nr:hypothetical protein [Ignavibacteria bacterium]
MNSRSIQNDLLNYTLNNSNHDTKRNYISMSHIHLPVDNLIDIYKKGFETSPEIKLKCYKGYQMERDILIRLKKIYGDKIKTDIEYHSGFVKGHPDFEIENIPGDCKSVLMDEWLPTNHIPKKVYWQMQGYLYLSKKLKGFLIYESRETGIIKVLEVFKNDHIQNQIEQKINEISKILSDLSLQLLGAEKPEAIQLQESEITYSC